MPCRLGINGFGRVGRLVLRTSFSHPDVQVVAINDCFMDLEYMVYLLKFDSIYGRFGGVISSKTDGGQEFLEVDGEVIQVFHEKDPMSLPWGSVSVDYVCESTGVFTQREKAELHLKGGCKKVVISAPPKDDMPVYVMGVNHENYHPTQSVVSNASCTTNCLAPLAKVINNKFTILEGLVTTVHALTAEQLCVDGPSRGGKDWRGGRCASQNIIPSSMGDANAVGKVIPPLQGKLTGIAFRVPVQGVSVVDLTCRLETPVILEEIVSAIKEASRGELKGILSYTDEEAVSSDFVNCPESCMFDIRASIALNDRFVKLICWYNNEKGYASRLLDLISHMASVDGLKHLHAPNQVCVCGGGNACHVMSALLPANLPETKVHLLSTFSDEAERWSSLLEKNGQMTLDKTEHNNSRRVIKAAPTLITSDPAIAVPGSKIIFIPLPAFAHQGYLDAIAPYVGDDTTIVGLPGYPGFRWLARSALGAEKASKIALVSGDTLPWAARITSFGASSQVIGTKSQMLGCTKCQDTLLPVQACIGKHPVFKYASAVTSDLMTTNPYIHLSIMYARWSRWDGIPLDEMPLFYQGADQFAADIMAAVNNEVVLKTRDAIKSLRPDLELGGVVSIYDWYKNCYAAQIGDTSSLLLCLRTNSAYVGLTHPMKRDDTGKYRPDYTYRYMTEDLPMGLVPLRALAHLAGVKTPTTDKVIMWCQQSVGKEYLKDGELTGRDISETRAPQNFGITSLDEAVL